MAHYSYCLQAGDLTQDFKTGYLMGSRHCHEYTLNVIDLVSGTPVLSSLIAHIMGIPIVSCHMLVLIYVGYVHVAQGVVSAVGVYALFNAAYDIGVSPAAPAPAGSLISRGCNLCLILPSTNVEGNRGAAGQWHQCAAPTLRFNKDMSLLMRNPLE